jgi:predicted porin
MKKSLFAIAAVSAFASAAQAQSSVTVYGIMDVGFAGTTSRASSTIGGNAQPQLKTNTTGFSGAGSETTSRLGFRGTEDLGGGTSAFFTAEFALNPTQMNLSGDANGGLFNRQAFVGVAQKGVGRAAIGTQYTPIHNLLGATDPGQQNNMIGSVIYTTSTAQGNGQTSTSYTVRQNQALTFNSERISGFQLQAMYVNGNSDRTQLATPTYTTAGAVTSVTTTSQGGNVNSTGYGIGANFTWQKLVAVAAYQSFKNETDNATSIGGYPTNNFGSAVATDPARVIVGTGATTTGNGVGTTATNGINITDNQFYVAAVYDFGILKAYANYINRKATSTNNSNTYISRTGQQIGVRSFITPKIEAWASGGMGRLNAFDTTDAVANFTAYQLGGNYWLSKRTNMYAIYGATQVSSSGGTAATATAGASSYALGLRHTF